LWYCFKRPFALNSIDLKPMVHRACAGKYGFEMLAANQTSSVKAKRHNAIAAKAATSAMGAGKPGARERAGETRS